MRIERLFLLLSIAIMIVFISFFGQTKSIAQYYAIGMEAENFKNSKKNIYIDEYPYSEKFGERGMENGREFVELLGDPIKLTYKYSPFLPKDIYVSATIKNPTDMLISPIKEGQNWSVFSAEGLQDYAKVNQAGEDIFYARDSKDSMLRAGLSDNKDDLIKYIPDGKKIKLLDSSVKRSDYLLNHLGSIGPSSTEINPHFRGDFRFYAILPSVAKISIDYQKIYLRENVEFLSVTIKDLDEKIVFQSKENIEAEGSLDLVAELPQRGVYEVSVQSDQPENIEWLTKYLKVNTDKIVFWGETTLNKEAQIYTNSPVEKQVQLGWWDLTEPKEVVVTTANSSDVFLSENDKNNISKNILLPAQSAMVKLPSQTSISGSYFAFSEESYFEPFRYDFDNIEFADFIISKLDFEVQGDWVTITKKFPYKELVGAIEKNKVSFEIIPNEINEGISFYKKMKENHFFKNTEYGDGIELWANDISKVNTSTKATSLEDWLNDELFDESRISVQRNLFINKKINFMAEQAPDGFRGDTVFQYKTALRGDHDFYVFLESELDLTFETSSGSGLLDVQVIDSEGNIVCENNYNLDLSNIIKMKCKNLNPSTYLIKLKQTERGKTYKIDKIFLNSNKIVLSGKARLDAGSSLYLGENVNKVYGYNSDRSSKKVDILLGEKKVREESIEVENILSPLNVDDGDGLLIHDNNTQINTSYASLSKENYFYPLNRKIITFISDETDFVIVKIKNPLLKEVAIELK